MGVGGADADVELAAVGVDFDELGDVLAEEAAFGGHDVVGGGEDVAFDVGGAGEDFFCGVEGCLGGVAVHLDDEAEVSADVVGEGAACEGCEGYYAEEEQHEGYADH